MTSTWWKEADYGSHAEELDETTLILTNQPLFMIMSTCDALNENVNRTKSIIKEYREMFDSRIPAGATEKLPGCEKPHAKTVAWSYMEGHAQNCVERYCELANKKTEQLFKVSSPCLEDHHFRNEELDSVGELSHVCSQIVLKCLYLARIG